MKEFTTPIIDFSCRLRKDKAMSKELKLLNASIDNERHVYTWKQVGSLMMIYIWVVVGVLWFLLLDFWKDLKWSFFELYFFSVLIFMIPYNLYLTVLRTSIEVNPDRLLTIKSPFNLLSKNIELEEIDSIYFEHQIMGSKYNIKANLKNGKKVKLLFGLKQDEAIELAKLLDLSVKHFQQARLTTKINHDLFQNSAIKENN